MTNLNDPRDVERAAREVMTARDLIWDHGPEWITAPCGGPPGSPKTIRILQARMLSTASGRTVFVEGLDDLSFWMDVRNLALDWDKYEADR